MHLNGDPPTENWTYLRWLAFLGNRGNLSPRHPSKTLDDDVLLNMWSYLVVSSKAEGGRGRRAKRRWPVPNFLRPLSCGPLSSIHYRAKSANIEYLQTVQTAQTSKKSHFFLFSHFLFCENFSTEFLKH